MARSHLFPRKLMHDIRREAKHLVGVRGFGRPVGFLQSGEVSQHILCHLHESSTQAFDDAAIRLMRSFAGNKTAAYGGLCWRLPNRKPEKLGLFVHATIWRHWAHWMAGGSGPDFPRDLAPELQAIIFDGAPQFPTVMMHAGRTHDGDDALFAFAPGESELEGVRLTRFEIGGFAFMMFHEHGLLASPWAEFQTSSDPLMILQLDHGELRHDPNIMKFVRRASSHI